MIAAPPKSNYSKPELFDYFIPLEKSIFTNCGTYDFPTSTNLSIKGGDYLLWPVLVTLSQWEPNPIQLKLSNRLLSTV